MGKEWCKAHVCSKTVGSKTSWDSTKVGKNSRGRKGSKGDSKGPGIELHDCGWHIHPSGGGNEECSSSSWRSANHNIGWA